MRVLWLLCILRYGKVRLDGGMAGYMVYQIEHPTDTAELETGRTEDTNTTLVP